MTSKLNFFLATVLLGVLACVCTYAKEKTDSLLDKVEAQINRRDFASAERTLCRVFVLCEKDRDTRNLAMAYYESGKLRRLSSRPLTMRALKAALVDQTKAIKLYKQDGDNPYAAAAYAERAQLQLFVGDRVRCLEDYDLAIDIYITGRKNHTMFDIPVYNKKFPTFDLLVQEFRRQAEIAVIPEFPE